MIRLYGRICAEGKPRRADRARHAPESSEGRSGMERNFDLICMGMGLVDSLIRGFHPDQPSPGGWVAASNTLAPGGEAVNAVTAAAKLGLKAGIVCSLGEDEAGNLVRSALERHGVDTSRTVKAPATPVSTIFIREDGTRKSIINEAHRFNFHPERNPEAFTDARILALGSLFRAPFDDPGVLREVVKAAAAAGETVIADTKLPRYRDLGLREIRDSLPFIDYLTPNEEEARYLTGLEKPEDMAQALLDAGVKHALVKLGEKGCCLKTERETVLLPAYDVHAVDATGAGDHFTAGLAAEILQGKSAAEALSFASACAAVCTTEVGAGTALKSREQVLRFMQTTPLKPAEPV